MASNGTAWLARSRAGYCLETGYEFKPSCSVDVAGAHLLPADIRSWTKAAEFCLAKFARCKNARFVTVSIKFRDCSWAFRCEMKHVGSVDPAFRSAPVSGSRAEAHEMANGVSMETSVGRVVLPPYPSIRDRGSVAVLYSGRYHLQRVTQTWPTHLRLLVQPTAAALFVFVSLPTEGGRLSGNVTCIEIGAQLRPWLAGCLVGTTPKSPRPPKVGSLPGLSQTPKWLNERYWAQYENLRQANQLRLDHERVRGTRYTFIVRARLDLFFETHAPVGPLVEAQSKWVDKSKCWLAVALPPEVAQCAACTRTLSHYQRFVRFSLYPSDHFMVFTWLAAAALDSFPGNIMRYAGHRCRNGVLHNAVEGWLLLELNLSNVSLSLVPLRGGGARGKYLSFDSTRNPATTHMLRSTEIATACVTDAGCNPDFDLPLCGG